MELAEQALHIARVIFVGLPVAKTDVLSIVKHILLVNKLQIGDIGKRIREKRARYQRTSVSVKQIPFNEMAEPARIGLSDRRILDVRIEVYLSA